MLKTLLNIPLIRRRLIHCIKQNYFNELDIVIPIKNNLWAHLYENDSYDSFSEIFVQSEYEEFLPNIKIESLIDLGAHHGFFTLLMQSKQPDMKFDSLLVEPSIVCEEALTNFALKKENIGRTTISNKCIGNPKQQISKFYVRRHMASSQVRHEQNEYHVDVPILQIQEVQDWRPPPYDLIKCDIEGGEWDLVNHYEMILKETQFIIIEWHEGKDKYTEFINKVEELNFNILKSTYNHSKQSKNNSTELILARNNRF